jgi:hypothetical protein
MKMPLVTRSIGALGSYDADFRRYLLIISD